jgi:hypothetical protein
MLYAPHLRHTKHYEPADKCWRNPLVIEQTKEKWRKPSGYEYSEGANHQDTSILRAQTIRI